MFETDAEGSQVVDRAGGQPRRPLTRFWNSRPGLEESSRTSTMQSLKEVVTRVASQLGTKARIQHVVDPIPQGGFVGRVTIDTDGGGTAQDGRPRNERVFVGKQCSSVEEASQSAAAVALNTANFHSLLDPMNRTSSVVEMAPQDNRPSLIAQLLLEGADQVESIHLHSADNRTQDLKMVGNQVDPKALGQAFAKSTYLKAATAKSDNSKTHCHPCGVSVATPAPNVPQPPHPVLPRLPTPAPPMVNLPVPPAQRGICSYPNSSPSAPSGARPPPGPPPGPPPPGPPPPGPPPTLPPPHNPPGPPPHAPAGLPSPPTAPPPVSPRPPPGTLPPPSLCGHKVPRGPAPHGSSINTTPDACRSFKRLQEHELEDHFAAKTKKAKTAPDAHQAQMWHPRVELGGMAPSPPVHAKLPVVGFAKFHGVGIQEETFVVDNSLLPEKFSGAEGIGFRDAPKFEDKDQGMLKRRPTAPWGSTVTGVAFNKDWLQVGEKFLPMHVNGIAVLRKWDVDFHRTNKQEVEDQFDRPSLSSGQTQVWVLNQEDRRSAQTFPPDAPTEAKRSAGEVSERVHLSADDLGAPPGKISLAPWNVSRNGPGATWSPQVDPGAPIDTPAAACRWTQDGSSSSSGGSHQPIERFSFGSAQPRVQSLEPSSSSWKPMEARPVAHHPEGKSGALEVLLRPVSHAVDSTFKVRTPETPAHGNTSEPLGDKIALVLDVDNTLVHTVKKTSFPCVLESSWFRNDKGEEELFEWSPGHPNDPRACYVKLRPGVLAFLEELAPICEMSVVSTADKDYLDFVLTLLDPAQELFPPSRVACRADLDHIPGDPVQRRVKHLRMVSHSMDRVVVFDDRLDVWQDELQRLHGHFAVIRAFAYDFLNKHRDEVLRALVGRQPLELLPRDRDMHLPCAAKFIKGMHAEMNSLQSLSTLKPALGAQFRRMLKGLRIHVIEPEDSAGKFGQLCQAAESFGANVNRDLSQDIHVVVCDSTRDPRFGRARGLGLPIVHGLWLTFCFATFALQDPTPFRVEADYLASTHKPCVWQAHHNHHAPGNSASTKDPSACESHLVLARLEKMRRRRILKTSQDPQGAVRSGTAGLAEKQGSGVREGGACGDEDEEESWNNIAWNTRTVGVIDLG